MAHDELIADYLAPMSPLPTSLQPGGSLSGKIQCVLFDIYGTLFISGSGDIRAAAKSLPPNDQLEHLLRKYDVGKTPQILVAELHDAIKAKASIIPKSGSTRSGSPFWQLTICGAFAGLQSNMS
jgi:hypothetical protein